MKIVFATSGPEERKHDNINGESFRFQGKPVSGTEQSMFIVAEQLVKYGHVVAVTMPKLKTSIYRGVRYIDRIDFIKNRGFKVDILVVTNFFKDIHTLLAIEEVKHIVVWGQCQQFDHPKLIDDMCRKLSARPAYVHVSTWSKLACEQDYPPVKAFKSTVISNPLLTENLPEPVAKEPGSFVFHAVWERGGSVACRAVKKLDLKHKVLYRCDYCGDEQIDDVVLVGSMDKVSLFNVINKCEYFVYPLVVKNGNVHRDTHACSVAEAMALGAIVLTYPIAALNTTYANDTISWIPFPKSCKKDELTSNALFVNDKELLSEEAVDNIVQQIMYLEAHPDEKQALRERARKFVLQNFNEEKIGLEWKNFLEGLMIPVNPVPLPKALDYKAESKVILTSFVGRRKNLEVLFPMLNTMMDKGYIHEVHLWNFTRNTDDETWIKETVGNNDIITTSYEYVPYGTFKTDSEIIITFKAQRDAHILVRNQDKVLYEIVLGGWGNTMCVLRNKEQGSVLCQKPSHVCNEHAATTIKLSLANGCRVSVEDNIILDYVTNMNDNKDSEIHIDVASWDNHIVWIKDTKEIKRGSKRFQLVHVANKKMWLEY